MRELGVLFVCLSVCLSVCVCARVGACGKFRFFARVCLWICLVARLSGCLLVRVFARPFVFLCVGLFASELLLFLPRALSPTFVAFLLLLFVLIIFLLPTDVAARFFCSVSVSVSSPASSALLFVVSSPLTWWPLAYFSLGVARERKRAFFFSLRRAKLAFASMTYITCDPRFGQLCYSLAG